MITSELFGVEKGLVVAPMIISSVFINIVGLVLIHFILDKEG